MQNQVTSGSAEQSATEENLGAQRGGLAIAGEAAGALKFSEQIEQQQDAAEGGFGGKELSQAKIIGGQIVFQFGDAIFHVRPEVVVAPDFFRWQSAVGDEDAEGIAGDIEQFSSQRGSLGAQLFADDHEAARAVPAQQLQSKLAHGVVLVQRAPLGDACRFPLQPARQPGHDDVGKPALLQKPQQLLVKKA